jgi:hypothetical protein
MIMEPNLLEAVTQALENCFGHEVKINDVQILSEAERRNRIARLFLSSGDNETQSVMFKQSLDSSR